MYDTKHDLLKHDTKHDMGLAKISPNQPNPGLVWLKDECLRSDKEAEVQSQGPPDSSKNPNFEGPEPVNLSPTLPTGSQLLAWVLWLQAWRVAAPCPRACVCYNEPKVTTSCPQQGLQTVPIDIPAASQRVFLHGNRIAHVPAGGFRACRNLTILWLHSNVLARIDAAAFAGLALLEQLDLSDNAQLHAVDPATFRGLGRLHTLHLDRCGLQELGPGLFHGLTALQYLYLQDNGLQALPDNAFRDLGNLTHLFLHGNRILSVPERAFRGLHSLDRLLLHQNRVAHVHPHAFRDLGRLMTLYLFANNLSALPSEALAPLRTLQYLRLNDNPWVCDCRARPLWAWLQQFRGSSSEVPCSLPLRLAGRDLKRLAASDLEGCVVVAGPFRPIRTGGPAEEVWGLPKCCQPDAADKASVLEGRSPASAGNSLKGRVPSGDSPPSNGSGPRHINDSPFGTLPGSVEPPLSALLPEGSEPPGPPTVGPRRRPGCSRKNRTRSQCRLGHAGSGGGAASDAEGSSALPSLACGFMPLGVSLVLWTVLRPC
ncbi:PREDICTED: reticulon-4 receptor [Condylura cristata]|uniref:reticulon-4 receptor n=1 Tax=Condylura cristata TaxID=143302 RepID=UPI000643C1C8|nr:PREDICTED: reticulon-4 receptor [Condylura cristata]